MKHPSSSLVYSLGTLGPLLAEITRDDLSWQDAARCAEIDGELWFPGKGEPQRPAKAICADCPVREPCLEYALEYEDLPETAGAYGVFGGLGPNERNAIRQERHRQQLGAAA